MSFCSCLPAINFILKILKIGDKKLPYVPRKRYLWNSQSLSDIWGSHSSVCKESCRLGCDNLFFSTMKLEVVGSSTFMVETELVTSSKTSVSFYQTSYPKRLNPFEELWNCKSFWRTVELCNRYSAARTFLTFKGWVGGCCTIKCTSFSSKREIGHSGNLKWIVRSCNRNLTFQSCILKLKSIRQYWNTENGLHY